MRESVLFIGTQFSNLYTAVDTSAKGRVGTLGLILSLHDITGARASPSGGGGGGGGGGGYMHVKSGGG